MKMMLRKTVMMATKSVLGGVAVVRVVAAHGDGGTTAVQLEIPANTNIETVDNKIDKTSLNLDISAVSLLISAKTKCKQEQLRLAASVNFSIVI